MEGLTAKKWLECYVLGTEPSRYDVDKLAADLDVMLPVINSSEVLEAARAAHHAEWIEHGSASPRTTITLNKAEQHHGACVRAYQLHRLQHPPTTTETTPDAQPSPLE